MKYLAGYRFEGGATGQLNIIHAMTCWKTAKTHHAILGGGETYYRVCPPIDAHFR